ncbi:MAG: DUF4124 domain-containing protein [Gammaproteobacteria bacterium]|nr:DUF4124 domain-containing protein [Gammaproteobacteria bacterium]
MRYLVAGAVLSCALSMSPAIAEIFRCPGDAGEVLYTQHPCGADTRVVAASGRTAAATGVRASETAWLKTRQKGKSSAPAKRPVSPDAKRRRQAKQAYQCERKRASLAEVSADLRRGYKPAKGEKLRRRRDAYEDYLAAFCR